MRSTILALIALCAACGGGDATQGDAVEDRRGAPTNEGKPFMPAAMSSEAMVRAADDREPMRYTAESGEVQFDFAGKHPLHASLGLDLVAMNIGDVRTLAFPKGYVKLDPLSLRTDMEGKDKAFIDTLFRRQGSPIQIFFQVDTISDLQGRMAEPGSSLRAHALGVVQVDDREHQVEIDVLVERPTVDTLVVEVPAFDIPLAEIGLDQRMAQVWAALGLKDPPTTVSVSGSVSLVAFTGDQLPTFIRTPVTVATVAQVVEKIDKEVDDYDAEVARMRASGVPEEIIREMDRPTFEAQNAAYEMIMRQRKEARAKEIEAADRSGSGR